MATNRPAKFFETKTIAIFQPIVCQRYNILSLIMTSRERFPIFHIIAVQIYCCFSFNEILLNKFIFTKNCSYPEHLSLKIK